MDNLEGVDLKSVKIDQRLNNVNAPQWVSIEDQLPPFNRPVLYMTEFYQSTGRLDEKFIWRTDRSERSEALPVLCWSNLL
jgi:hypothetical protein